MEAFAFLRAWIQENRRGAALISGAVALFAAVAVIGKFGIDLQSTVPSVVWILVIGMILLIIERLIAEPFAIRALALFFGSLIILWVLVFIWERLHPRDEEIACLTYFWQPCVLTADSVNEKADIPQKSATPDGMKARYQVLVQFAGYRRATIIDLARALVANGWNIQDASRGGERTAKAASTAEVRYRDGDKIPAEALAVAINSTKLKTVSAAQNDSIASGTLEVWIGQ